MVWIREFLICRTQRVMVGGQSCEGVRANSDVPQGILLGLLLFLAYVNDNWRNMESTIRLFADDCVTYRKIINNADMEKLHKALYRLGDWVVENAIKIIPSKIKAVRFTIDRVNDPLNYSLMGTLIPETSSCKYLGIILRSDLSWADQINYAVKKAWKALHFTMRIVKKGNSSTKSLAYISLVRPILEYVVACWDPYREGQIIALDRLQKNAAKFAHYTNIPK